MSSFDTDDSNYTTSVLNSNSNLSSNSESSISDTSSSTSDSNSDAASDVDSNYDDEIEEIIEDIYFHEEVFLDSEKQENQYYIGINKVSRDNNYTQTRLLYLLSFDTISNMLVSIYKNIVFSNVIRI
jgi:hypothetical protein